MRGTRDIPASELPLIHSSIRDNKENDPLLKLGVATHVLSPSPTPIDSPTGLVASTSINFPITINETVLPQEVFPITLSTTTTKVIPP